MAATITEQLTKLNQLRQQLASESDHKGRDGNHRRKI